jgi:hypothetical protein
MLDQRKKQNAIDAMEFDIYEEDDSRYVQFHDFLFACVQRVYKHEHPSRIFSINDQTQSFVFEGVFHKF